jgi:hypothetical protein
MIQQASEIETVADVLRLIAYEKELGVFIFLEEDKMPPEKIKALKEEKARIENQIKNL